MKTSITFPLVILIVGTFIISCDETYGVPEITAYVDADGDGYGDTNKEETVMELSDGFVLNDADCDDTNAAIHPDAVEVPDNNVDENCDGLLIQTWYRDADGDGFGDEKDTKETSESPEGYVDNSSDCDDTNKTIYPGATEIKGNDVDENCDGTKAVAVCGDGTLDIGEVCDDGNTTLGDGCNDTCDSDETCGNGILDQGEVCDDGNTTLGDGCNDTCTSDETCGNGIVDVGEECDDGNTTPGDGCDNICELEPICGNGIVEGDEICDDGNTVSGDGCNQTCDSDETCGNAILDTEEECDDGNTSAGDGCTESCLVDTDNDGIPDNAEVAGCETNPRC